MAEKCIIDGCKESIFVTNTSFANHSFKVVKCVKCGLIYIHIPDSDLTKILKQFYECGDYSANYQSLNENTFNLRNKLARKICLYYSSADSELKFLLKNKFINHYDVIVDLGCGEGNFVIWLQKKGYEAYGVEPDNKRALIAKEHLLHPNNILVKDIEQFIKQPVAANIISSLHVLEHLERPDIFLKDLKRMFPKCKLHLAVPNCNSKKNLEVSLTQPHIYHFNRDTLKNLVKSCGWNSVLIETSKGYWHKHLNQLLWIIFRKDVYQKDINGENLRLLAN